MMQPKEKILYYAIGGWAIAAEAVLWTLYFTHERDLYKLFALLGLTVGLIGVGLIAVRTAREWEWKRPVGLGLIVLAFFLHGFANFTPDLFPPPPSDSDYSDGPQANPGIDQGSDEDGDDDGDYVPGNQFPDV